MGFHKLDWLLLIGFLLGLVAFPLFLLSPQMATVALGLVVLDGLIWLVFWIWMLLDAFKRQNSNKILWILIVFFLTSLGALIYYLAVFRKTLQKGAEESGNEFQNQFQERREPEGEGTGSGIRNLYYSIEDKYYDLLEWLSEKGVPVFKITDPIDKHFPSFVLFILLFLLFVVLLIFVFWGPLSGLFAPQSTLGTLKVTDSQGNELQGIKVKIHLEGKPTAFEITTGSGGLAKFDLTKPSIKALVSIKELDGFEEFEETITFVSAQVKKIQLVTATTAEFGTYELRFKDSESHLLITNQILTVSYDCSQSSSATPSTQTTQSGRVSVKKSVSCGTLTATVTATHGYNPATAPVLNTSQEIFLEPLPQAENGEVEIKVIDGNNHGVPGTKVKIGTDDEPVLQQSVTNTAGKTTFTLVPGTYIANAVFEADGRNNQTSFQIQSGESKSITINIGNPPASSKKIFLKIVDKNSQQVIEFAYATIYKNQTLIDQKQSNSQGLVTQAVAPPDFNKTFSVVVYHPLYLVKVLPLVALKLPGDQNAAKVELEKLSDNPSNYGKALAKISSESEPAVKDARVYVYRTDYQNPLFDYKLTDIHGEALFSNLAPTTGDQKYFLKAFKSEGESEKKTIAAGQTAEFPIRLVLGKGRLKLTVKDYNSQQPISGATVIAFKLQAGQRVILDQNQTNSQGQAITTEIQVEQTVFFEISKTGYLTQTTTGYETTDNSTIDIPTVFLISENYGNGGVFVLYNRLLKDNGQPATILKAGERYWAVFTLGLPKNTVYNNPIAHADAGERDLNQVSKNNVAINGATTYLQHLQAIVFSSDFNQDNHFADYNVVSPPIPAKQVNIKWSVLPKGAYEFRVAFTPKAGLPDHTEILLYYQAKALDPVDENVSSLELKRFVIGEPVCEPECKTFLWRAYYSFSEENDFKEVLASPAPRTKLLQNANYDIKYEIYNFSSTTFSPADLSFSAEPGEIKIMENNGFQGQRISHGWFDYGMRNPMKIETKLVAGNSDVTGKLKTTPLLPPGDDTNQFKMRFQLVGSLDLNIDYKFGTSPPYTLRVTVTEPVDQNTIPNADIEIQKNCAPRTQQQLDEFIFNPADPTYQRGATGSSDPDKGIALFNSVIVQAEECLVMRASNVPGYRPKTIIHREPLIPWYNSAFECIQIDTNPSTPEIDSLFEGAKRNNSYPIKVVSRHCQKTKVCLHTLDAAFGDLIAGNEVWFTPNIFVLDTDQNQTVTVRIGATAPLGYVPFFSLVTDDIHGECLSGYSSFAEFVITPKVDPSIQEGFGIVEESP